LGEGVMVGVVSSGIRWSVRNGMVGFVCKARRQPQAARDAPPIGVRGPWADDDER
jgi:hypothetical protein